MSMKGAKLVLVNPCAGGGRMHDRVRSWASDRPGWRLHETRSGDHARELAEEAALAQAAVVVAAGGDGTVHDVVQGLMATEASRPVLGVLPCGTANDFTNTIGLDGDWSASVAAIDAGHTIDADVIRAVATDDDGHPLPPVYVINAATGGLSVAIDDAMDEEVKQWWGRFSYAKLAIEEYLDATAYDARIEVDGQALTGEALAIVVANGVYAGGVQLAPRARADDGRADVCLVRGQTWDEGLGLLADLALGRTYASERFEWVLGSNVTITSEPAMPFIADGEQIGRTPLTLEVCRGCLRVLTPPDHAPPDA
jgi:diacylglycerol kinase (ATP)